MNIQRITKLGAVVVAAAVAWASPAFAVPKYTPLLPASQARFTLDLPIPIDYVPDVSTFPGTDYYEVQMSPVSQIGAAFPQSPTCLAGQQWLGLRTPAVTPGTGAPLCTSVWGYSQTNNAAQYALNGKSTYPSMSFRAKKGTPVKVKWVNNAPDQHLFCPFPLNSQEPCAIDRTLMGVLGAAIPNAPGGQSYGGPMQADNAMVVHLHGGEIPPDSDGFAELWFGNAASSAAYTFPSVPVANSFYSTPTAPVTQNIEPPFDASLTGLNGIEVGNLVRPTGNSMIYNYPMVQAAAPIWYHDHALGKTRINVAAGPAGFFIIEDPAVEGPLYASGALPPRGDCSLTGVLKNAGVATKAAACFDINVAIQDRAFNNDGSINFPNGLGQAPPAGAIPPPNLTAQQLLDWQNGLLPGPNIAPTPPIVGHPQWVPEYFGDMAVVNGVIWPKVKVEPRPYRFRLLDGSNARCYELSMKSATLLAVPRWNIIGSDQGYLPAPTTVKTLVMCPGERYDVVVDFSAVPAGTLINVSNSASAPYPAGIKPGGNSIYAFMGDIMQFQVVAPDPTNLPAPAPWVAPLALVPKTALGAPAKVRQMLLNEVLDPVTLAPLRVQIDGKAFETAVTETPKRGTIEQWTIVNTTVDAHPMHLHLVQFEVVSRQAFDLAGFQAAIGPTDPTKPVQSYILPTPGGPTDVTRFLKGKPRAPEPGETGWKDTARAYPGEVLTVKAKWDGGWADKDPVNPALTPLGQTVPLCAAPLATDAVWLTNPNGTTCGCVQQQLCAAPPAGYLGPFMTTPPPGNTQCMCVDANLDGICDLNALNQQMPVWATPAAYSCGATVYKPYWEPVTAGPYVWHCHIVDHEDNEMMRPTLVVP